MKRQIMYPSLESSRVIIVILTTIKSSNGTASTTPVVCAREVVHDTSLPESIGGSGVRSEPPVTHVSTEAEPKRGFF